MFWEQKLKAQIMCHRGFF